MLATLKILLIEDTPADRVLFVNQIQSKLGTDVVVDCAERISEAFSFLESAQRIGQLYDQIWLDPGLPDLGTQHVSKVLARLKEHVEPGELRMLVSAGAPEVERQAKQQNVPVLNKDAALQSGNPDVLEIVRELLAKRSSGTATVRVEQARMEGRVCMLEDRLDRIEHAITPLTALPLELQFIKQAVVDLTSLKTDVTDLKRTKADQGQLRLKRMDVFQAIGIVLISSVVAPIVVSLMNSNKATQAGGGAPSPSTSPSTTPKP